MASFNAAWAITGKNEGGYASVRGDNGGETYAGITRKNFPLWPGWKTLDIVVYKPHGYISPNPFLVSMVVGFYVENFWNRIKGDEIDSQKIANFIFDWFVNSGDAAIKHVQAVVGCGRDGIVGEQTIGAINAAEETTLLSRLIINRLNFYHAIVEGNPSQQKFLNGWLARTNAFA